MTHTIDNENATQQLKTVVHGAAYISPVIQWKYTVTLLTIKIADATRAAITFPTYWWHVQVPNTRPKIIHHDHEGCIE